MLRRVTGDVKNPCLDVPEVEPFVIVHDSVLERGRSTVVEYVFGTCLASERAAR
jgi:hypothetical protein